VKFIFFVSALLLSSVSFADSNKPNSCAEFARGAAEATYLEAAKGIDGHQWESHITSANRIDDKQAVVRIEIFAAAADESTWTAKYDVIVEMAACNLVQVVPL
jgi:hypothetical protein